MLHKLRLPLAALAGLLLLTGCPDKKAAETSEATAPAEAKLPKAPVFNADSAYAFTAKQVAFGPRVPNSKAHIACGDWLVAKFKSYGLKVMQQPFEAMTFDGTNIHGRNIIAQYQPQAARRVAIFGHWDTRPFADADKTHKNAPMDGASDGASAVAVALEIARVLSQQPDSLAPNVGVDFILFDAEDWGHDDGTQAKLKNQLEGSSTDSWCLGSQYWSTHLLPANYKAEYGVLLDMVGAKGGSFTREETSRTNARTALDKIWNTAARLGYSDYFRFQDTGGITDDHVYTNKAGIPTLDIYDHPPYGDDYFPAYHHATTDNMSIIDRKTLKAVGQTMVQSLYID
ncbi:M28 family peptidase [Hymenobacter sp. BT770]|uniref:M28 family peptidase n=1 Tax=Hymenobacter sp. BT770 TaxID=2886942 RepID=UPI001D101FAA|nr:M28 family peptidase [Hymenobacter sp. BT770]MCC3154432.1 M28 family peptidase [Hymenobacter sp. BT770]MDO3416303.1 M28 family peptidase [Hymenobacter sp. BT770]